MTPNTSIATDVHWQAGRLGRRAARAGRMDQRVIARYRDIWR